MIASPFRSTVPALALAGLHALAGIAWLVAGDALPGGRWLAVHLFTLGVLSNVVLAFTAHFALTLTRQPGAPAGWHLTVLNLGTLAVLVGVPTRHDGLVAAGATTTTLVVLDNYRRLRGQRRGAVGARFGWIVRVQERAHGAFVHGALLGGLLGTGVLPGQWVVGARFAHLHVNLLGWGGLTLLSTLVFFGPTMARVRILDGADETAARALRHGASALTLAVFALLATGVGGAAGSTLRVTAGILLAAYAVAAWVTCRPVAVAAARGPVTAARWHVVAVAGWFPVLALLDALAVATERWWALDGLGLAFLVGVLAQAVLTTAAHVAPTLRPRSVRAAAVDRLSRHAGPRAAAFNAGVALILVAALLRSSAGASMATAGWVLVLVVVLDVAGRVLAPIVRREDGTPTVSR